jgi:hypothetical protein
MVEIVYILTNEVMPGLVKIGRTADDLATRIRGLYQTGVPLPFELFYACEVLDSKIVEAKLHDAFDDHRVSTHEFFRLAPERARAALSLAAIKEIKLGDAIYETPEAKAEVETAKRRSKFQLSMIGLKPGTELQLFKDPTIICKTVDEQNKVDFKGEIKTLSEAALQALQSTGIEWPTASGPWEWAYQGKRLDDIRREIEKNSD